MVKKIAQTTRFTIALLALATTMGLISGCSSGQCSNIPARPTAEENKASTQTINMSENEKPLIEVASAAAVPAPVVPAPKKEDTILIYKDSGEKQCGMGKTVPLDEAKAILEKKKILVYESHTQDDGLIHMQLCGSASGKIHVFSILKKNLKKAQTLGFKPLVTRL